MRKANWIERWCGQSRSHALVSCMVLGVFLALQSCAPPLPSERDPTLHFEQAGADCAADGTADEATISVEGRDIAIYGVIIAGSPCQHLVPHASIDRGTVSVAVEAVPQPGTCVLCVGAISYSARLSDLAPGGYRVVVKHEGETIAEADITLNAVGGP